MSDENKMMDKMDDIIQQVECLGQFKGKGLVDETRRAFKLYQKDKRA